MQKLLEQAQQNVEVAKGKVGFWEQKVTDAGMLVGETSKLLELKTMELALIESLLDGNVGHLKAISDDIRKVLLRVDTTLQQMKTRLSDILALN